MDKRLFLLFCITAETVFCLKVKDVTVENCLRWSKRILSYMRGVEQNDGKIVEAGIFYRGVEQNDGKIVEAEFSRELHNIIKVRSILKSPEQNKDDIDFVKQICGKESNHLMFRRNALDDKDNAKPTTHTSLVDIASNTINSKQQLMSETSVINLMTQTLSSTENNVKRGVESSFSISGLRYSIETLNIDRTVLTRPTSESSYSVVKPSTTTQMMSSYSVVKPSPTTQMMSLSSVQSEVLPTATVNLKYSTSPIMPLSLSSVIGQFISTVSLMTMSSVSPSLSGSSMDFIKTTTSSTSSTIITPTFSLQYSSINTMDTAIGLTHLTAIIPEHSTHHSSVDAMETSMSVTNLTVVIPEHSTHYSSVDVIKTSISQPKSTTITPEHSTVRSSANVIHSSIEATGSTVIPDNSIKTIQTSIKHGASTTPIYTVHSSLDVTNVYSSLDILPSSVSAIMTSSASTTTVYSGRAVLVGDYSVVSIDIIEFKDQFIKFISLQLQVYERQTTIISVKEGSVKVEFRVVSDLSSSVLTDMLNRSLANGNANITVSNKTYPIISIDKFVVFFPSSSRSFPSSTSLKIIPSKSTSITTSIPPTKSITTKNPTTDKKEKNLVVLYATIFSVVGFVLIVIIAVVIIGFRRNETTGSFRVSDDLDYELGSFQSLPRAKVTNMYGAEPTMANAAERNGNVGNNYEIGNNLPRWELPPLEIDNTSTKDKFLSNDKESDVDDVKESYDNVALDNEDNKSN